MSTERFDSRRPRWSVMALACLGAWLLVQNTVLLVWLSGRHLEPLVVVVRAIARLAMHLAAEWWMLPAAVILGVALALTGGERPGASRVQEVSHVR